MQIMTGFVHVKLDMRADVLETVVSVCLLHIGEVSVTDIVVQLNLHVPSSLLVEL